ncbi:hypothetical protein FP432_02215 [Lactobacillus sp. PV034]|nr:hypothetical protein FP432_02215 [Lactobacillus sp. PV034]
MLYYLCDKLKDLKFNRFKKALPIRTKGNAFLLLNKLLSIEIGIKATINVFYCYANHPKCINY